MKALHLIAVLAVAAGTGGIGFRLGQALPGTGASAGAGLGGLELPEPVQELLARLTPAATATPGPAATGPARKVLYYRNPMGLPDISPVPKKDGMGMDYVAVYEDDAGPAAGAAMVRVTADRVQRLGVRTEPAARRRLVRDVHALGTLEVIERNLHVVSTKFPGWVEKLHADTTGQPVRAGAPLMELYSPELVVAQQDYLASLKTGSSGLGEAALRRLNNWDISEDQLQRLRKEGTVARTLTVRSPISGMITLKDVFQGQMIQPGMHLYHIADLSRLWVVAEVFEPDIGLIRAGQTAEVTAPAAPGRTFAATVAFIHPAATPETRTTRVHLELDNAEGLLRPALSAAVALRAPLANTEVVTIPDGALLDSGSRRVVLVERGEGLFEPRPVQPGARTGGWVEIRDGLEAGERVVTRANFLIDAESNLRAALAGFAGTGTAGGHEGHGQAAPVSPAPAAPAAPAAATDHTGHGGPGARISPPPPPLPTPAASPPAPRPVDHSGHDGSAHPGAAAPPVHDTPTNGHGDHTSHASHGSSRP